MKRENKFLFFVRKNAVYLILTACILAVGLSITLMVINENRQSLNDDQNPTVNSPVEDDQTTITPDEPDDNPVINPNEPNEPDAPVSKPIIFALPVENPTSIGEYSETMVFNSTLNRYSAHMAIDFFADEGTNVLAVYDGTITNIENTLLKGTTITIDHGNGLFTVYNSLADGNSVTVGQVVKQGDVIGQVSVTNRQEYKSGAHLHFEVFENGENIDPAKYLALEEK
ncbi:MAG: M23 family metallopeptidase [Clostridia bacterium]|nr:M23 family metallopeptidase [Clostridia bacterium]